jgi:hypothetical protein
MPGVDGGAYRQAQIGTSWSQISFRVTWPVLFLQQVLVCCVNAADLVLYDKLEGVIFLRVLGRPHALDPLTNDLILLANPRLHRDIHKNSISLQLEPPDHSPLIGYVESIIKVVRISSSSIHKETPKSNRPFHSRKSASYLRLRIRFDNKFNTRFLGS